jgi:hypothetical protein
MTICWESIDAAEFIKMEMNIQLWNIRQEKYGSGDLKLCEKKQENGDGKE